MILYVLIYKKRVGKEPSSSSPTRFIVLLFLADHVLRVEGTVELLLGEDAVLEDNVVN